MERASCLLSAPVGVLLLLYIYTELQPLPVVFQEMLSGKLFGSERANFWICMRAAKRSNYNTQRWRVCWGLGFWAGSTKTPLHQGFRRASDLLLVT